MAERSFKTEAIREVARRDLTDLVDKVVIGGDKRKGILLDPCLLDPFKLTGISKQAFSKERGVEFIAAIDENSDPIKNKIRSLLIFVRPNLKLMQVMAKNIRAYCKEDPAVKIFIYFVPRKTLICQHLLMSEYGITDDALSTGFDVDASSASAGERTVIHAEIDELEIDFFPLEEDVLSMESPHVFKELFLDGDPTSLEYIARSLLQLQRTFVGPIPRTVAKGTFAVKLLKFLRRMTQEVGFDNVTEASQVESMFILDRGVDLMTPLMTQLTYEGILDELYGIKTCQMKLPFTPNDQQRWPQEPMLKEYRQNPPAFPASHEANEGHVMLNSTDNVFLDIRDRAVTQIGSLLHDKSVEIKRLYDRRKDAQNLKEIKEIIRNLPLWQETQRLISIHVSIVTHLQKTTQASFFRKQISMEQNIILNSEDKLVLEYIEELIDRGEPFKKVIRLICMFSIANNGLKPKVFEQLRESLMLSYGIPQVMSALYALERSGLLTRSSGGLLMGAANQLSLRFPSGSSLSSNDNERPRQPFSNLRKACRLWVEGLNDKAPTDVGYVHAGYAPLLLRTVETLLAATSGNAASSAQAKQLLAQIPGETDTLTHEVEVAGHTRTVLIFVLGGVTQAEISAVRYILGALDDGAGGEREEGGLSVKRNFLIVSTGITSGSKMIGSLLPFEAA